MIKKVLKHYGHIKGMAEVKLVSPHYSLSPEDAKKLMLVLYCEFCKRLQHEIC
jgi:hypothetical protein